MIITQLTADRSALYPAFIRQIAKLSTLAKLTQAKYGTSTPPAICDQRKNTTVAATISSHRITISANAHPGRRAAKKIHDQAMYNSSWPADRISGIAAALNPAGMHSDHKLQSVNVVHGKHVVLVKEHGVALA